MNESADTPQPDPVLTIQEIEARQDDVIYQLDELNQRVENLIELYSRMRQMTIAEGEAEAEDRAA